jgi:hypothetical protein
MKVGLNMLRRIIEWLDIKEQILHHPESPGMKRRVIRSRIGRFFKPKDFACLCEGTNV